MLQFGDTGLEMNELLMNIMELDNASLVVCKALKK